jgi:hypothetical protein
MPRDKEVWSIAKKMTDVLEALDKKEGTAKTNDAYDGFCNGYYAGVMAQREEPPENTAFGQKPLAAVRVIVGITKSGELTPDTEAYAVGLSVDMNGVTDSAGAEILLSTALAAVTALAAHLQNAIEGRDVVSRITSAAAESVVAIKNKITPDIKIVDRSRT